MKTKRRADGARWAIWERFDIKDAEDLSVVYLRRWYLIDTPYFGVYLHKINTPDPDRPLHDHPWDFVSLILRGGYTELLPVTSAYRGGWKRLSYKGAKSLHRIAELKRVPTWTLIFVGRRKREWGFLTEDGWVQWDLFLTDERKQEVS